MFQRTQEQQTPLLSNYTSLFWEVYKANYTDFDIYFKTKYKSFYFLDQEEDETLDAVISNWLDVVKSHLRVNDKRYNELFRIQVVPDDESYSIVENYYLQETYNGSNDNQGASASGQRTDINNFEQGNQKQSNLNSVSAYNSSNLNSRDKAETETGTRNDRTEFTQGKQDFTTHTTNTDTHTMTRHGAIGTQTADQVLEIHQRVWENSFKFYDLVFSELANYLTLEVCDI